MQMVPGVFKTTDAGHTWNYVTPSGFSYDLGQPRRRARSKANEDPKFTLARLFFSSHARTNVAVIDLPSVNLTKRNQTTPAFVPKREPYALEALKQRKSAHATKFGMLAEHPRQTVTGNTAAQVMDMVDADVCREPAQDSRKIIMRTAMQSCFLKAPPVLMRPECPLELMLHVEQPYSH